MSMRWRQSLRVALIFFAIGSQSTYLISQEYALREIQTLGGGTSEAFGINNHLQVVGDASLKTNTKLNQAFVWSLKGTTNLGPTGQPSVASAINDSGQVVGSFLPQGAQAFHAFLWTQASGLQDLGTLGGAESGALAINSSGIVVGYAIIASGAKHAFVWTASGGMQDIGTLGDGSVAFGVNDLGQVVGAFTDNGADRPFLWSAARGMRKLPTPEKAIELDPNSINNKGLIVGSLVVDTSLGVQTHAVIWPHLLDGGVQDVGTLPGGTSSAFSSINTNGQVVGDALTSQGEDHAILWTESGGMQDLNGLVTSDWVVVSATAINSVGCIAVNGQKAGDTGTDGHALLLTPTTP